MKAKIQVLYIGVAVLVSALLNLVMLHRVTKAEKMEIQQNVESGLPTGNYLPDAENPLIRVLIKTNGFRQVAHEMVQIQAEGATLLYAEERECVEQSVTIYPDDKRFEKGSIRVVPQMENDRSIILSLTRGYGIPSYCGTLELFSTAEGIVIVNELPVETYLCGVVPSEMPETYGMEALKCQAICARSYAYCQMQTFGYPEYSAHVDDSVSYQVYGNSKEQETTTRAVSETEGKKLWYQNQVVKTYYYSTSSGHSTSVEAWGTTLTDENRYLKGVSVIDEQGIAYEKALPWYRWKAEVHRKTLEHLIELNMGKEIGNLKDIAVTKQGTGGVVLELTVTGTTATITIQTENKIRKALGGSGYEIAKQDGTVIASTTLLPSAFFTIAKNGENYIIEGGGYGHGIGMSQNGANEMSKAGKNCEEILTFFYPGTVVQ